MLSQTTLVIQAMELLYVNTYQIIQVLNARLLKINFERDPEVLPTLYKNHT